MKPKEEIAATIPLSVNPVRRIDATEKARQLLAVSPQPPAGPAMVKLTTRIFAEQMAWMKEEITQAQVKNPRAPKLTVEELTRLALDHLRNFGSLEALLAEYRSG
jgi:hypothetical protein